MPKAEKIALLREAERELRALSPNIRRDFSRLNLSAALGRMAHDLESFPHVTPEEITAARRKYADGSGHNIQIDEDAAVSRGADGTWVQAWVFIDREDI